MSDGLRIVMTCPAIPEQYDVYDGDKVVGYLRLRSGWFTAEAVQGDASRWTTEPVLVYSHEWDNNLKGEFSDQAERDQHIAAALAALSGHYEAHPVSGGSGE